MARLTVAFVTDAIYPFHHGGKESRYFELSQRLCDEFDVQIHTMRWWPRTERASLARATLHTVSPRLSMYVRGRRSILQAVVFAIGCVRLLGRRFDVIEADHMPYIQLFVLRVVASIRRKPLVVTWHEVWGRRYWRRYLGPAGMGAALIERLSAHLPDHIIAASAQTAERLKDDLRVKTPITVIPNGVDLDQIRDTPATYRHTDIVVVGRLIEHKRVDLILDAIASLRRSGYEVTCRIVGSGPQAAALQTYAMRLGLLTAVDFRDDISSPTELYRCVKSSPVMVLASEREGFGIAALEGLACGLAVVTTSAPDNLARHIVKQAPMGFVCEPEVEPIATAIMEALAADHTTASRTAVQELLEDYTWDAAATAEANVLYEAHKRSQEKAGGRRLMSVLAKSR